MSNLVTNLYGVKCDNPKCDWKDMTVPYDDYPSYIGKPCPACGWDLMSKQEYCGLIAFYRLVLRVDEFATQADELATKADELAVQFDFEGTYNKLTIGEDNKLELSHTTSLTGDTPEKVLNTLVSKAPEWLRSEMLLSTELTMYTVWLQENGFI